jgi:poly-gamma-glutamate biosynthesis protein PgsC/CapC
MIDLLSLSIGIGLAISLLFSEMFGLAAGGMVVPGYVALSLSKPLDVVLTLATGLATFTIVHALSSIVIIYGKRRTVLMILIGYLLGATVRILTPEALPFAQENNYQIIGYVIPGLIAIWFDRQGIIETVSALVTASIVVRLVLILTMGGDLLP